MNCLLNVFGLTPWLDFLVAEVFSQWLKSMVYGEEHKKIKGSPCKNKQKPTFTKKKSS